MAHAMTSFDWPAAAARQQRVWWRRVGYLEPRTTVNVGMDFLHGIPVEPQVLQAGEVRDGGRHVSECIHSQVQPGQQYAAVTRRSRTRGPGARCWVFQKIAIIRDGRRELYMSHWHI